MPDTHGRPEYLSKKDRVALSHAHALWEAAEWLVRRHGATDPVAVRHAAALRSCVDFVWRLPDPALQIERMQTAEKLRKAAEAGEEFQRKPRRGRRRPPQQDDAT